MTTSELRELLDYADSLERKARRDSLIYVPSDRASHVLPNDDTREKERIAVLIRKAVKESRDGSPSRLYNAPMSS
jgi:hypothetical protein